MAKIERCLKHNNENYNLGDWVKIKRITKTDFEYTSGRISEIGTKIIHVTTTPWFKNEQYGYHQEASYFSVSDIIDIERTEKMFD